MDKLPTPLQKQNKGKHLHGATQTQKNTEKTSPGLAEATQAHTSNPRANTSSPGLTQAAQGSLRQGRGQHKQASAHTGKPGLKSCPGLIKQTLTKAAQGLQKQPMQPKPPRARKSSPGLTKPGQGSQKAAQCSQKPVKQEWLMKHKTKRVSMELPKVKKTTRCGGLALSVLQ